MSGAKTLEPIQAPAGWRVTPEGTVPIADVARTSRMKYGAVDYTVRACKVQIIDQHGQGNRRYISVQDALLILAAASLAVLAGVALSQMFRAVRESGASMTPEGLTIPVTIPGTGA